MKKIKFNILTMFPKMFQLLDYGIVGKYKNDLYSINIIDLKTYGSRYEIDSLTYGSKGMLMCPEPIHQAIEQNQLKNVLYTSPRGFLWNNNKAVEYSKYSQVNILCGRYEGVDQRVIDYHNMKEVSIGDFILSGGEMAAMVMIDSICRFAGAVKPHSLKDSFSNGLLEHDNYTRPKVWKNMSVPQVLLEGNHSDITQWKTSNSIKNTLKQRSVFIFESLLKDIDNITK